MVSLKYLVPPKPARISPPAHHKDMISRIYAGLGRSVIFQSPSKFSGPGGVIVRESKVWETAEILVRHIGENTPTDIHAHLGELLGRQGIEVIYLEVPLDQSGCGAVSGSRETWILLCRHRSKHNR